MKTTLKHDELKKRMMDYSSFMDNPGQFLGYSSYTQAVKLASGFKGWNKMLKLVADDMIREGHFKKCGKVYIAMKVS